MYFFKTWCPLVLVVFIKDAAMYSINLSYHLFRKSIVYWVNVYSCITHSALLIYTSILMLVQHGPCHCNTLWNQTAIAVHLCSACTVWATPASSPFQTNFRTSLSFSTQKPVVTLICMAMNLSINWRAAATEAISMLQSVSMLHLVIYLDSTQQYPVVFSIYVLHFFSDLYCYRMFLKHLIMDILKISCFQLLIASVDK